MNIGVLRKGGIKGRDVESFLFTYKDKLTIYTVMKLSKVSLMTVSEQPFFIILVFWWYFAVFILSSRDHTMPRILQAPKSCLVLRCQYMGPSWALGMHKRIGVHEAQTMLFLCPLPGCSYMKPRQHNFGTYWEQIHGATWTTSAELRMLPLLEDFVVNRKSVDPGACCPPVPP